jgi:hypothetical protein
VTDVGAGVARGASGRYYAVQMFGRPRSQAVRFTVTNETDARVSYRLDGKPYPLAAHQSGIHERCRAPTLSLDGAAGAALHPHGG